MKITPIKFAKGFHNAIMEGLKTQTRRIVKDDERECRYGLPGDYLECDIAGKKVRLLITRVEMQHVREITLEDSFKEIAHTLWGPRPREKFMDAWILLQGHNSWVNNDLVWVIEFKRDLEV